MKKYLLFTLFIFLLVNAAACGRQEGEPVPPPSDTGAVSENADDEESVRELIDNTVQFSNSFTVEGKPVIQDMAVDADFGVVYPDLESVYNRAANVVVGEVRDVRYTDDEAIPRTIYTFAVSETLKGDIEKNSLISISESNGYVRIATVVETYGMIPYEGITDEEIENGVVLQSLGGAPLPKAGDQCVVFLGEQKQEGRIEGAYAVIGNFMGKYVLDQDTNLYSRFCPSENPDLYTVYDSATNAVIQEEPMSLPEIREEILSYQ
jgi:hypothetical protein